MCGYGSNAAIVVSAVAAGLNITADQYHLHELMAFHPIGGWEVRCF